MTLSLIAAMAENRVIGRDNRIPWRLPADLRHFKATTMGHSVIMGRKTFASIGRPLPGRRCIVLSRRPDFTWPGIEVAGSLGEALALTEGEDEAFVAGGGSVYAEALPRAARIYLTVIHAEIAGDTYFPRFEGHEWRLVDDRYHDCGADAPFSYSFRRYERR